MTARSAFRPRIAMAALFLSAASLASAAPAQDAPTPPDRPQALDNLARCLALGDDAARLACYDREAQALVNASDTGEVKVVDKAEAKEMRRSLFGFTLPEIALFNSDDKDDDKRLETTITGVSRAANGRYILTLEGGAVWRLIDSPYWLKRPKTGDSVELERAAMGTYWVRINGKTGVKGVRDR